jgi:hypothetical protein
MHFVSETTDMLLGVENKDSNTTEEINTKEKSEANNETKQTETSMFSPNTGKKVASAAGIIPLLYPPFPPSPLFCSLPLTHFLFQSIISSTSHGGRFHS